MKASRTLHRAGLAALFALCACGVCAGQVGGLGGGPGQPVPAGEESMTSAGDVISVAEIASIEGRGKSVLRGVGIVTGLKGTGDSGTELALARPLAKIYEANGNPLPDLKELAKSKAAALVFIEVTVPASGARLNDELDVHVTVSHTATSLAGGRLFLSPLQGPLPGQGVYAMASGPIELENNSITTAGVVRSGARIITPITMPTISDRFDLVLKKPFRHHTVADQLADTINALMPVPDEAEQLAQGDPGEAYAELARAMDDTLVRVTIPPAERGSPTKFIAKVMSATFSPSLLRLPAQVVVNSRTGSIIVTGNVELSAVAIAHRDLVITTVNPPPTPSPATPVTQVDKWTAVQTTSRASERARIQDLIQAFRQLDLPIQDQINILYEIHRTGRLHAELVVE